MLEPIETRASAGETREINDLRSTWRFCVAPMMDGRDAILESCARQQICQQWMVLSLGLVARSRSTTCCHYAARRAGER